MALIDRFLHLKGESLKEVEGKTVLITGASSGLGSDFARILGDNQANLVLTARSLDKLEELKKEIEAKSGVSVYCFGFDLSKANSPQKLYQKIKDSGLNVDILINNAGSGLHGHFAAADLKRLEAMAQLNINSVMQLSRLVLPEMIERRSGYLLQVASIAGFMPLNNYAVYAASKAFVLNFSQALNWELAGTGVSSTALCPGATRTSFFKNAGHQFNKLIESTMMDSESVVRSGLSAMLARQDKVIPGVMNKVTVGLTSHLPNVLNKRISEEFMK